MSFYFIYAFVRMDMKKSLQEPEHILGSKNVSGIFSKQIVSQENKRRIENQQHNKAAWRREGSEEASLRPSNIWRGRINRREYDCLHRWIVMRQGGIVLN